MSTTVGFDGKSEEWRAGYNAGIAAFAAELSASKEALVNRFLAWPLPPTVCSDLCATEQNYKFPRIGTNLLTAIEARQMIEYLLGDKEKDVRSIP